MFTRYSTAFHCFWDCPANDDIEDEYIQRTNTYKERATREQESHACLWLRGLLPEGYIEVPPADMPVNTADITWSNEDKVYIGSGTYYGDASGGPNTKYPEIRRVAASFVCIDAVGDLLFGAKFPLEGDVQTVNRGELMALVTLIRYAENNSIIHFITDNEAVKDKVQQGPSRAIKSNNRDLYHELLQTLIKKNISLSIDWMPSHLDDPKCKKVKPDWVTEINIKGNGWADKLAEEAAEECKVSIQAMTDCKFYYRLIKLVQWRLIRISQSLPKRDKYKTVRTPQEEQQTFQDKCDESRHQLDRSGDRMSCSVCMDSFLIKDPSFLHWLAGRCVSACSPSGNISNKQIHIGNQYVHYTHRLVNHKGLVYCRKCGSRATKLIKLLAKPCEPPSKAGQRTLDCVKQNRPPPGFACWPDES